MAKNFTELIEAVPYAADGFGSQYAAAIRNVSGFSSNCPIAVLQLRQRSPRTTFVRWSWSMCSFLVRWHIAHRFSCFLRKACNSSSVIPCFLARSLSLKSGSAFRNAFLRAFHARRFLSTDLRASSLAFSGLASRHLRSFCRHRSLFSRCHRADLAFCFARCLARSSSDIEASFSRRLALVSSRCLSRCFFICSLCDSRYFLALSSSLVGLRLAHNKDLARVATRYSSESAYFFRRFAFSCALSICGG